MDSNIVIKQGDTLSGLAQQYSTTVANLQQLNPSITDPNKIFAGASLKVGAASPSVQQNIGTASANNTVNPSLQPLIDSATSRSLAPSNFRVDVPSNIPSGAISPQNTSRNVTSTMDEDRARLMSRLTPTEPHEQAIQELASVRAEIARRNEFYRQQEEKITGSSGVTTEQAQAQLSRLSFEKNRELQSLSERQTAAAQTLQSFQQQQAGQLDVERLLQTQQNQSMLQREKMLDNYANSLARDPLPSLAQISKMSDQDLLKLTAVQRGLQSGFDLGSIKTDMINAATLRDQEARFKEAQISSTQSLADKRSSPGTTSTSLTPTNRKNLLGVGFSETDINSIQSDVTQFGVQEVINGLTDINQKNAIRKVYGLPELVTRESIISSVNLIDAQKGLKSTYTEDELSTLARDNGFAFFFSGKKSEIEQFLNSDKAKELYVNLLYQQYKDAGQAE